MRKLSLYGIITLVSLIVRQFVLPNPFDCFGDDAIIINWITEPIIQIVAYGIVGIFYIRGSAPTLGSILYLFIYAFIVVLLWILGIFSFSWWWILIIVVAITALICGGILLKERFFDGKVRQLY